ncbi:MAG: hypothetical protein RI973_2292 [Bacteroidota bacterium]|jgi:hypothetical protein
MITPLFLLLLMLPAFGGAPPAVEHDFKLSVCEIIYDQPRQLFELKFYLFQDDLRDCLYDNPIAPELKEKDAVEYIRRHFSLWSNQQQQELTFQSLREKNDQVLVTFNTRQLPLQRQHSLKVQSTVFLEKFRQQTNMIYVILPERSKLTKILNAGRTEGEFEL